LFLGIGVRRVTRAADTLRIWVPDEVPLALVLQVVDPKSPAATNEDTPVGAVMAKIASIMEAYLGATLFSVIAHPP
jgi:hypothetical protein